jgi:tRNA(fMet)-specific endonuclease VapC
MRRAILDTNILSDILKGRDPQVVRQAITYAGEHGRFTYSAVTVLEILYGLHYKDARRQLALAEASFNDNEVVVPILGDYRRAGEIRGKARSQGNQLTSDDCLIGAIAERLGVVIATANSKHFDEMKQVGLVVELENWRAP